MKQKPEMEALGYTYANLLFYRNTGEISPGAFDVMLYHVLLKEDENAANGFYSAVMQGDENTKSQYHNEYWNLTKQAMQKHVDNMLRLVSIQSLLVLLMYILLTHIIRPSYFFR